MKELTHIEVAVEDIISAAIFFFQKEIEKGSGNRKRVYLSANANISLAKMASAVAQLENLESKLEY